MRSFTLTTTAALAATATASTVTLKAKPCSTASTTASNLLTVSLDTASPIPQDLTQICGLSVLSASASVSLDTITCRIYSDAAGTSPTEDLLSLGQDMEFVQGKVNKASLLCKTTRPVDARLHAVGRVPRAEFKNTTSTHLMVASGSPPAMTTAHMSLQTAAASAAVSGSAGLGSSHHGKNGTSLSATATPTQTSSEAQASETGEGESGAVKVGAGWGFGVLVAGVVAILL
ncbi:hypothetical protein DDE82_001317 [Stemphylium lycopersici]|uniref:Uncharacterized protein n=1 Tax=Stemphylium lycopersici TaxID=183478 RepID=A0A364NCD0_STELY|nr:hypothetical protein TW65_06818 [Stemphylium lycopersici]RAR10043.1 hypothetical protein DDE82_001317 [Stemphylium lycopersici]RAR15004.1 hypothetical protein DDE83_001640 [Stemphylium lycopersici]